MAVIIKDLSVSSPDIASLERIPEPFAGRDSDRAPRLAVTGLPEGTVELTIALHDPDAPMPRGFTHWITHGITPEQAARLNGDDGRMGPNSLGEPAYVGPFPPAGHGLHHYYFWVYALNTHVEGEPSLEEFLDTYGENVIEQARLVGTYSTPAA